MLNLNIYIFDLYKRYDFLCKHFNPCVAEGSIHIHKDTQNQDKHSWSSQTLSLRGYRFRDTSCIVGLMYWPEPLCYPCNLYFYYSEVDRDHIIEPPFIASSYSTTSFYIFICLGFIHPHILSCIPINVRNMFLYRQNGLVLPPPSLTIASELIKGMILCSLAKVFFTDPTFPSCWGW